MIEKTLKPVKRSCRLDMKASCGQKLPEQGLGFRVWAFAALRVWAVLGFLVNMDPEQLKPAPTVYTVGLRTAGCFGE